METFANEIKLVKFVAEAKVDYRVIQQKMSTGFSRMSVMANLLRFGCFAAG